VNSKRLKTAFLESKIGDLSISVARGRARPEVTSPIESSTTVFYQSSIHISCLTCIVSKLLEAQLDPTRRISTARSRGARI
jgi:hypothetical protein